jgi:C4-dicarboxylate-specific signal transduction histidine kinase
VAFRPRARLVSILGEHLISDQAVGLVELVKNAYDADATEVEIQIFGLGNPDTTTVIIRDNGTGMTLSDIQDKWLSPAVDHKERDKQENRRTKLGRLPIGEKGVGRFAVHQIGKRLELITRAANSSEIVLPINWDRFETGDAYLDSMTVTIEEREPQDFVGSATGTLLKIERARSQWTRQLLEKVHRTLRRLQSPLKDAEVRFRIVLQCPSFPEFENVDPTDILERAHYEFQGLIDKDGQCDFEYHCKHPALSRRSKSGTENLVPLASKEVQGNPPRCGPFWVNLYVWDRAKDYLSQAGISAKELNAQCGVSLFRDGLRVLPYGEPGDDWLLLDQERIQDPSGRISNNQVVGLIQVLQENNLQLRDKTNREGLIENDAFLDLRAMSRAAIRLFTSFWKKDRPRDESAGRVRRGSLAAAKRVAQVLEESASDELHIEIPGAVVPPEDSEDSADSEAPAGVDVQREAGDLKTVTQREAVGILIENIDDASAVASDREKRIERLLTLAATGLAAERVVHEFGRQVAAALEALARLRVLRGDTRTRQSLEVLGTCLETLSSEFRILAPYEAVERAQKLQGISAREAADLALTLNKRITDQNGVQAAVEGQDFQVKGQLASLVQILDNLVHNACYWLAALPGGRPRRLVILVSKTEKRIVVADSGPGVHEEARPHLFQPFFSMKAGGTGLGLYISNEIARRMHAGIRLASNDDLRDLPSWATGATFVLEFAPRSPRRG